MGCVCVCVCMFDDMDGTCSICTLQEAVMACDCHVCKGMGTQWCSDKCFSKDRHVDEIQSRPSFFKRSRSSSESDNDVGQTIIPTVDRFFSLDASKDRSNSNPMVFNLFKGRSKVRVKVRVLNEKVTFEVYSNWTSRGEVKGPVDKFELVFIKEKLRFVENVYEAFELEASQPGKKITAWVHFDPRDYKVTTVRDSKTGLIGKRLVKDWTAFLRLRIYTGDETNTIPKMLIVR